MYTGWTLLGLPVGPTFFEQRRMINKAVGPTIVPQFDTLIQEHVESFLATLPTASGDPFDIVTP